MFDPSREVDLQTPVPEAWRPTLRAVVDSLVRRDEVIADGVAGVRPVEPDLSAAVYSTIDAYGDVTVIPLPEDTWATSVAMYDGDRWGCVVDLWTAEEGRSDLVLQLHVYDDHSSFRYDISVVHVP